MPPNTGILSAESFVHSPPPQLWAKPAISLAARIEPLFMIRDGTSAMPMIENTSISCHSYAAIPP
jgi:hypothetical protein